MDKFFCADRSQDLGELAIGTANQIRTYVLIECPTPWSAKAIDSRAMPVQLGQVMRRIGQAFDSVRFLLVNRTTTQLLGCRSVIIYQQKVGAFCDGYDRFELTVNGLEAAAAAIEHFFDQRLFIVAKPIPKQDVLICTHGSHDQCCARYGNPFYAAAQKLIETMDQVEVWRSSHFGGHRFAPTAMTFPDGRYYARLTIDGLRSILQGQVNSDVVRSMYRGWGILPAALQVVEQQLLERFGDRGYGLAMRYEILKSEADNISALLAWIDQGELFHCYCDLSLDHDASVSLLPSCHATEPSSCRKYRIDRLEIIPVVAAIAG
jgi:hypothetical protein